MPEGYGHTLQSKEQMTVSCNFHHEEVNTILGRSFWILATAQSTDGSTLFTLLCGDTEMAATLKLGLEQERALQQVPGKEQAHC